MAVKKKYASNVLGRGLDDMGLGRGLDALIDTTSEVKTGGSSNLNEVELTLIDPNPNQPRREFDQEALQELANSIRELGIIQPITLRKVEGGRYQIIAGERRWRASQLAGLQTIPAYIVSVEDQGVMEMALVENIQREDLNAIEIALAYQHLAETTGMTQAKISERVGKSRAAVTNYLRLLKLPAQVQIALKNHEIDMGHARALLALDSPSQQIKLFMAVQQQQLSVRKVEEIVQSLKSGDDIKTAKGKITSKVTLPEEFNVLRDRLAQFFQAKVQMTCSPKGKGKISILFDNEEQLEHIMNALDGANG